MCLSQRRACKALGVSRSTQRYQAHQDNDELRRLVARMHELVRKYPRYGYRMIGAKLRQQGWRVNQKKIYRLWRREGFRVPRKTCKKRRLGHSGNSCLRRRAEHPDHVWTWDCAPCKGGRFQRVRFPPGNWSLQPVAIGAAVEVTKPPEPSMERVVERPREQAGRNVSER